MHGYKHLALSALKNPALIMEILEDRKNLEALTGAPVTGMAYAYGDFDDRVVSILADCGIAYAQRGQGYLPCKRNTHRRPTLYGSVYTGGRAHTLRDDYLG